MSDIPAENVQGTLDEVKIKLETDYKTHLLEEGPKSDGILLTRAQALKYYENMLMVRNIEIASHDLYLEGKVRGFCHESTGEEASPVGIVSALEEYDYVIGGYRIHGWGDILGLSPEEILCELTGGLSGNSHGKGGSMHIYSKTFFGGRGIVGAQISLGLGLAFAKKYRNEKGVAVAVFGDGTANQGQFYESANIAKLLKLPMIFICENNGYAMFTPVSHHSASTDFDSRLSWLPGIRVDGMDVIAVREAVRFARKYCEEGKGPIFIELDLYRFVGHQETDKNKSYRSKEEIKMMKIKHDPIKHIRKLIMKTNLGTEDELEQIEYRVEERMARALEKAEQDRGLPMKGLYTDIYANTEPQLVRGRTAEENFRQKPTTTNELLKNLQIDGK